MLLFKIPFLFYFWNLMLLPNIMTWATSNESCNQKHDLWNVIFQPQIPMSSSENFQKIE